MILLIKKLNKTRDNSTGFTIQWGAIQPTAYATTILTLPKTFSSALAFYTTMKSATSETYAECLISGEYLSTSQVQIGSKNRHNMAVFWLAIGFS